MHIFAIVTGAFGAHGGISQYNRDFLTALAEVPEVSSVRVLPRIAADRAPVPAGIEQFPERRGRIAYIADSLRLAFGGGRVDVVFCGHLYLAPLALLVARLKRAKLVIQTHGIEAWPSPSRLIRAAVEQADLVLAVSRFTRAQVLNWAAIPPDRVIVVPNTVGDAFTPGDASSLRARWQLEGKQVLLTVGRLDPRERYKGHDRVIKVIPQLVGSGYDVVYLVVGGGDDRARLESLAQGLGVSDRVRFLGELDSDTLVDTYRTADLFVMPSTGEGFGIAFLEAMATGTPALGLAVAGSVDALADGELGIAVEESGFPDAVIRLLDAPKPDAQALAAAVRTRFGRSAFVGRVRAAIASLQETRVAT